MREFARHIYASPQWRRVREYVLKRDDYLCQRCGRPGNIVHHKVYLTPQNVNNPEIALGADNLEAVCEKCHAQEHEAHGVVGEGLAFNADGTLMEMERYELLHG